MKRPVLAILVGLSLSAAAGACSTSAPPRPAAECRQFQFRACKDPCGRGVQRCLASGRWGPCSCVVGDASYSSDVAEQPDAESEGDATTEADAGPDALPSDSGRDADAATDRDLLD